MTKLITAEEWRAGLAVGDFEKLVQAIQLNAAKWGMEQAAEISSCKYDTGFILTAANKLELPKD